MAIKCKTISLQNRTIPVKNETYLPSDRQEIIKKQLINVSIRFEGNARMLDIDGAIPPTDILVGLERVIPKLEDFPDWEFIKVPRHSFDVALICDNIIESKLLGYHYQQIHDALKPDGVMVVHCLNSQLYSSAFHNWKFRYRIGDLLQHASINGFILEQCMYSGEYPKTLGYRLNVTNFRKYVTLLFSKSL